MPLTRADEVSLEPPKVMTLIGGAAVARSRARPHEPLRAPDSVQSELRNVPGIGLELTSLDALDNVSQHIVGAAC
jgi:hypothetical protein